MRVLSLSLLVHLLQHRIEEEGIILRAAAVVRFLLVVVLDRGIAAGETAPLAVVVGRGLGAGQGKQKGTEGAEDAFQRGEGGRAEGPREGRAVQGARSGGLGRRRGHVPLPEERYENAA